MSSSAIDVVNGIASPPALDSSLAAVQASPKPQATTTQASATPASTTQASTTQAPATSSINGTQQILLIPTKPPLSAKVMAELLGEPMSLFGTAAGETTRDQYPAHTQASAPQNTTTVTATTPDTTTATKPLAATTNAIQLVPSLV